MKERKRRANASESLSQVAEGKLDFLSPVSKVGAFGFLHCLVLREHLRKHHIHDTIGRGRSSAGRAPALQAGGQEFDSPRLHHLMGL